MYWPSVFVVVFREMPVSVLVTVTVTLGIAAPEGSLIVPKMVASWASAGMANQLSRKTKTQMAKRPILLLPWTGKPRLPTYVGDSLRTALILCFVCDPYFDRTPRANVNVNGNLSTSSLRPLSRKKSISNH
jgi:hypothetical protein